MTPIEIAMLALSALAAIALVVHFVHSIGLKALETKLLGAIGSAPAPQPVDHAAVVNAAANVVAAATGKQPAMAQTAATAASGPAIFDPAQYPDAVSRLDALRALQAKVGITTPIVSPRGYKISVQGLEIIPTDGGAAGDPHAGTDFGTVPSGNARRNTLTGGAPATRFTFTVAAPTKMRLAVASDQSMGKPLFDNFTLTVKLGDQVVASVSQAANSGQSFVAFPQVFQPGSYTMDFGVDKTDIVVLQFETVAP